MFITLLFSNPLTYFSWLTLVVFSICFHEYMHARAAVWQGDMTPLYNGNLTLNPLKQMGIFSLCLCAIIGIAWGAVPINPRYMRKPSSEAIVSFAGPFGNLILFMIFSFLFALGGNFGLSVAIINVFAIGAVLNIVLFLFNMLPLPMLDGVNVFAFLFPKATAKIKNMNQEVVNGITFILFFLVFFNFHILYLIGMVITKYVVAVLKFLLSLVL